MAFRKLFACSFSASGVLGLVIVLGRCECLGLGGETLLLPLLCCSGYRDARLEMARHTFSSNASNIV